MVLTRNHTSTQVHSKHELVLQKGSEIWVTLFMILSRVSVKPEAQVLSEKFGITLGKPIWHKEIPSRVMVPPCWDTPHLLCAYQLQNPQQYSCISAEWHIDQYVLPLGPLPLYLHDNRCMLRMTCAYHNNWTLSWIFFCIACLACPRRSTQISKSTATTVLSIVWASAA